MVEKIGNTGIRPQDFYGHCPQCHRDCLDDASKFFLGDGEHGGKFSLGFEVEDKFKNFAPNASEHERFLTKDYPSGSVSGGDTEGEYTHITVQRCTQMGDIRIAYSDSYTHNSAGSYYWTPEVTYMKKPETYYAEKQVGPRPTPWIDKEWTVEGQEWSAKIRNFISCRHKHTDHIDDIKAHGRTEETTIDDCVQGIWNGPEIWNVVDTFTTIEEIDVYAQMDYFSVYPICDGGITTSSITDGESFIVDEKKDVHNFSYKFTGDYYGGDISMSGNAFFVLVNHGGTGCRDNDARRSLHPHMVGVNAGAGENYKPTGKNGPDPRPNRGRHFKQTLGGPHLGLYRQTLARRVGKIYKTTINESPHPEDFQHGAAGEYYTLVHPDSPGKATRDGRNNFWYDNEGGCESTYGSPSLLQFPCKNRHTLGNVGQFVCDEYENDFCESQKAHMYESLEEVSDALVKRQRRKLVRGGAPTIPRDSCASLLVFSKCTEGKHCTDYNHGGWNDAHGWGRPDPNEIPTTSPEGQSFLCRTAPLDLDWKGFLLNRTQDTFPEPVGTQGSHQFIIQNYKDYEIGADDHYDVRSKYYTHRYSKKHCDDGNGDILVFLSFYTAKSLGTWLDPPEASAMKSHSWPLEFELNKKIEFELKKPIIPDDYGTGGVHSDIEESLKAWTCVYAKPIEGQDHREVTNYEAAGVFYRYTQEEYNFSTVKQAGWSDRNYKSCYGRGFNYNMDRVMAERDLGKLLDPDTKDECHPDRSDWRDFVFHPLLNGGSCDWWDDEIDDACGGEVTMDIFTGAGAPPPRYDVEQRVKDDCMVKYDDISKVTNGMTKARDHILACSVAAGVECPVLDDEDEPVLDEDGEPTYKEGPCLNDEDWIFAVHREFYKFKVPKTFYSCGETIGEGSDPDAGNNGDVCNAKWPCTKCCGLVPHGEMGSFLEGCSKCTDGNFIVHDGGLDNIIGGLHHARCVCRKGDDIESEPANLCCSDRVPNEMCLNNPEMCKFQDGTYNGMGCNQHQAFPADERNTGEWCYLNGALAGEKHSPFENGYLWYTHFGLIPERWAGYRHNWEFRCYTELDENCWDRISSCCIVDEDKTPPNGNREAGDFISCELIAIPRIRENKPIEIDMGELPVKITLRSPDCKKV